MCAQTSAGNGAIGTVSILVSNVIPISNTCFPAKTRIVTDQGEIQIEQINTDIHTIRGNKIVAITKTNTVEKHLICFEKDSIGKNIPSKKTIISKNHKLLYKGKMIKACDFIGKLDDIYKIKYNGELLYNVLMEDYSKMIVNNLICETLQPEDSTALLYKIMSKCDEEQRQELIGAFNANVKKHLYR